MTIKEAIQKAIENGFYIVGMPAYLTNDETKELFEERFHLLNVYYIVLSPSFWQALGKADWKKKMHGMIDTLIEGKSVEEYFEML